ncbi:Planctomycete cytochrome C [Planctomycetales bacterium 10988]|nr:Planctomycete cytochrome C [Planctomycetales bacterium 10988]
MDFQQEIAPILEQHCIRCHTPGNNKGDLSLATIDNLEENGYLIAGDPEGSYLLDLVTALEGMPPEMPKDAEPLNTEEVALVREWISQGAHWPDDLVLHEKSKADSTWWSYQPLDQSPPPSKKNVKSGFREWKKHPIDRFIFSKLAEENLEPNPPADRRTLIRRATYDLTGLPPTPAEVEAFVNNPDPNAYEKLIDRLLASPRYGERWGRHWLDVVRFGESNGFERNVIIDSLWPFRDYVIDSFNEDKPFDQFIREHLAGDILGKDQPDVAVGSAFLVAGAYDNVKNQDPAQAAQIRANTLDEIINATGQAFLGMTLGCARCHDHKFDPISQRDYYGLYATFSAVTHGAVPLATPEQKAERAKQLAPILKQKKLVETAESKLRAEILARAKSKLETYRQRWTRPPVDRTGTEERFDPVSAKFVRLLCEAQDITLSSNIGFAIDEFEVWSTGEKPRNVALASNGGTASGESRQIEDFPNAYGPQHANDGKVGARFLSRGNYLTIELAQPTEINRVVFSSARGETTPEHRKFVFVAEYRIEISDDGEHWVEVANSHDRMPVSQKFHMRRPELSSKHVDHRLFELEITPEERRELARLTKEVATLRREISEVPVIPSVWIGTRNAQSAEGPFHIFLGGSPQRPGEIVQPASLSVLDEVAPSYDLPSDSKEATRRTELAEWIADERNPLPLRVLANRLWHYHFGTGIVDTPNDLGYMGGRPTHPELLDFLANKLIESDWRLKPMHRFIMLSQTYRQSSDYRQQAGEIDGDARLLWRFPPRRLSAEEVRDTILQVSGKLNKKMGGPGFRLYHFMQDNVCTYVPLDEHGPETYRRAVYHQNARASVVDLMTEFDQPDCTFSSPRRAETTTPLQALTLLNHQFTLDMAHFLAERLQSETAGDLPDQIERAYQLCYSREPSAEERQACQEFVDQHGLPALCRVLLNTSELIFVR